MEESARNGLRNAIEGTLVADAAAMGLHWIYSQGKIASVVKKAGGNPEFLDPDEENYKGVPSFFAHPLKTAGEGSNYSAYLHVLFTSLERDEKGSLSYSSGDYIRRFQEYFGVGGEYVGYPDNPMRETIYNLTVLSKNIKQQVRDKESSLPDEKQANVAQYLSRYVFELSGDALKARIRDALKLHEFSREELDEADRLIDSLGDLVKGIGPDDDQMPALSRSALFAALYEGDELDRELDQAVRITNNNDLAVAYSRFMAYMLKDLYALNAPGDPSLVKELALRHIDLLPSGSAELVKEGLGYDELNIRDVTKRFGAACHVDMAVPLSLHILQRTGSYPEAVRANIMASGDNCGRSIFLGAIAGALYGRGGEKGIPADWSKRTVMLGKIEY